MKLLFWISTTIIIYHYLGYGILITFLSKLKEKKAQLPRLKDEDLPAVTLVIAAYNEEEIIKEKIKNSVSLDYPENKLNILFVTDGSTDQTNELIENHPQVNLSYKSQRAGKIGAINRIMPKIESPITIFSDANVMINEDGLKKLVAHFQNNMVGGVSGEKTILQSGLENASSSGEGLYWKYESFLKQKDAEWNTLVGSAGELIAIRTHLYRSIAPDTIIEDFVMSMELASKGYKVAYEPRALAQETASESVFEEKKRKVRISAGGIQAVIKLLPLLNFLRHGKLTFQYVSHRALRWTLVPLALIAVLLTAPLLAPMGWFYDLALRTQLIFYLLAFVGYSIREMKTKNKYLHVPYYFTFMNICVILGWFQYFSGKQTVIWKKAKRAELIQP